VRIADALEKLAALLQPAARSAPPVREPGPVSDLSMKMAERALQRLGLPGAAS